MPRGRGVAPVVRGESSVIVLIVVDRKWLSKSLRKTKKALQAVTAALKSLFE